MTNRKAGRSNMIADHVRRTSTRDRLPSSNGNGRDQRIFLIVCALATVALLVFCARPAQCQVTTDDIHLEGIDDNGQHKHSENQLGDHALLDGTRHFIDSVTMDRDDASTTPVLTLTQAGLGDAGILLQAGSQAYFLGIDNSVGNNLRLSTDPENVGAATILWDVNSAGDATWTGDWNIGTNLEVAGTTLAVGGITDSTLTEGSVIFSGAAGLHSEDNANFFFNDTLKRLGVGIASPVGTIHIDQSIAGSLYLDGHFSAGNIPSTIHFRKANGSIATPTTVADLDNAMIIIAEGYDGAAFIQGAHWGMTVSGTPSSGVVPMRHSFATMNDAGDFKNRARIEPSGWLKVVEDLSSEPTYLLADGGGDIVAGDDIEAIDDALIGGSLRSVSGITDDTLTEGSIMFSGPAGLHSEDNANLFWDDSNDRLGIFNANPTSDIEIAKDSTGIDLILGGYVSGFTGPSNLVFNRATGTRTTPLVASTTPTAGANGGLVRWDFHDGTGFIAAAHIAPVPVSISTGIVEARLHMAVMNDAGSLANKLRISGNGLVEMINSDAGIPAWALVDESLNNSLGVDGNLEATNDGYIGNDLTVVGHISSPIMMNFDGTVVETIDGNVTSDGATITFDVEASGGGDLTFDFDSGFLVLDTTPAATIALTAGSDTVPQSNFIFVLESTGALTKSTTSFPTAAQHAKIADIVVQSAGTVQTDGALSVHFHTDHAADENNQGHASHIDKWIRAQHATYQSGIDETVTINAVPSPDEIALALTSGIVLQLHEQSSPSHDTTGGDLIKIPNDSVSPYTSISDLNELLTDSLGGSMAGSYFNLVLWASVSEKAVDSQMFINLPSGSYNKLIDAQNDVLGFNNHSLPAAFQGASVLLFRFLFRHQAAAGGTWTLEDTVDLRGSFPSTVAGVGGATPAATTFSTAVFELFDNADNTKRIDFDASNITTGNNRTLTAPDYDYDFSSPIFKGTATFDGVTVDITTGTDEDLAIAPNGTGELTVASFARINQTANPTLPLEVNSSGTSSIVIEAESSDFQGLVRISEGSATEGQVIVLDGANATHHLMAFNFNVNSDNQNADFTVGGNTQRVAFVDGSLDNFSVGPGAATWRLSVDDDVAGFAASIINEGNAATRNGLRIQHGEDTSTVQNVTLGAFSGDGTAVGTLEENNGTFQLTTISDRRAKKDIAPTRLNAVDIIKSIPLMEYRFARDDGTTATLKRIGWIAQDVESVYGEAVSFAPTTGTEATQFKTIAPAQFIPLNMQAIKQLETRIVALEDRVLTLEEQVGMLIASLVAAGIAVLGRKATGT